jgi:hypothetical protein
MRFEGCFGDRMGFLLMAKMTAARTRIRLASGYYMVLNMGLFW